MKNLSIICLLLVLAVLSGCKKPDAREEVIVEGPKRDVINYRLTIVTRTETGVTNSNSHNGDTLVVKVNGNKIVDVKGSVGDYYGGSGGNSALFTVKTGDVVWVYYNPGKVVFNGNTMIDENGLAVYADYNNNRSNLLLKEFACRCIGVYQTTMP